VIAATLDCLVDGKNVTLNCRVWHDSNLRRGFRVINPDAVLIYGTSECRAVALVKHRYGTHDEVMG